MVDGRGDPNTSTYYREAIEALYAASYAVRAAAKSTLGKVHTVGPLEGLWSADDPEAFRTRDKSTWEWTMMIAQPDWITADMVEAALAAAQEKLLPALDLIRFERCTEGRSVQILHVGPYDDEAPTLERAFRGHPPLASQPAGRGNAAVPHSSAARSGTSRTSCATTLMPAREP
jgi:hypothetical protein